MQWENTTNEAVLEKARAEIRRSWREVCELNRDHPLAAELFNPDKLPAFHDPFAGGGAIPLAAQQPDDRAHRGRGFHVLRRDQVGVRLDLDWIAEPGGPGGRRSGDRGRARAG